MKQSRHLVAFAAAATIAGFFASSAAAQPVDSNFAERLYAGAEPGSIALYPCQLGEQVQLDANGIKRVAVDDASIVRVSASEDGSILKFDCSSEGSSIVTVDRKGQRHLVAIRVAAVIEPPSIDALCGGLSGVESRVILGKGEVTAVVTFGVDDKQRACLDDALRKSDWSRSSAGAGIARITW